VSEPSVKHPLGVCERPVRSVMRILPPRDLCPFGGQGGAEPGDLGRRPWKPWRSWIAAVKNLPGYGDRNGRMVDAGTGEALPGPGCCVFGREAMGAYKP
jgi:hypothetical protein